MFSAVVAARETSTRTGLCRNVSVRRVISGGMVAEKNSVWRVKGTSLQMRSMSGMKPMSSIRSASSMTRISMPGQQEAAALGEIEQTPGRRDDDVRPAGDLGFLIAERHAANQKREIELVVDPVFAESLLDLGGELARRLQNERARHAGAGAAALEHRQHRQGEGGGLAGAGLGDAQHVAALQRVGNGLFLDWRRRVVAGRFDGVEHLFAQAEFTEFHVFSLARTTLIRD